MNQINKETKFFISISSRPSNFGTQVYNNIFKKFGINAVYKSFKVNNIKEFKKSFVFLGLNGASISMPYKEDIVSQLDHLDKISKKIKIVNTIKNKSGKLYGYNTDFLAIKKKFSEIKRIKDYHFLIYGTGSIAKTVIFALNYLNITNVYIKGRNKNKIKNLRKKFKIKSFLEKEFLKNNNKLFLINCSSVGMKNNSANLLPFKKNLIRKSSIVMDLVNYPSNTKLIRLARSYKKKVISGSSISLYQIKYQSKIYLNKDLKVEFLKNLFKKLKINF